MKFLTYIAIAIILGSTQKICAAEPTWATPANIGFGMDGTWFNPEVDHAGNSIAGGFDIKYFALPPAIHGLFIAWYAFDPNGNNTFWITAQGSVDTVNGNPTADLLPSAHLRLYMLDKNGKFNTPTPPGQAVDVGSFTVNLVDCNHMHIEWSFDRTLPNGISGSGETDVVRITPLSSVLGQDLCTTPLQAFDPSYSDSDLAQCNADYTNLYNQYSSLNSDYNSCIDAYNQDEGTIADLYSQIDDLNAAINTSYSNGYNDGYTDGFADGDDYSYSYGYSDGYNDGYYNGYNDGQLDCPYDGKNTFVHFLKMDESKKAHDMAIAKAKWKAGQAARVAAAVTAKGTKVAPQNQAVLDLIAKMKQELASLKKHPAKKIHFAPKRTASAK